MIVWPKPSPVIPKTMNTTIEYPNYSFRVIFVFLIGVGVILHVLQLPSILSKGASETAMSWAAWPHRFHFWVLEALVWLLVGTTLAASRLAPNLFVWWQRADPSQRAVALGAVLITVQVILGLGFWLTRDKGIDQLGWLRAAFWMGSGYRIPVFFATFQLWFASWLAFQCYRLDRGVFWFASALVFIYLGFDELFSVHEAVGGLLKGSGLVGDGERIVSVGSVKTYFWPLVFLPLLVIMSAWFFVTARRTVGTRALWQLVLAGLVFVTGAIGLETVEANGVARLGDEWLTTTLGQFVLLTEESLETLGVTIAVVVFAKHRWQRLAASPPRIASA
ncbi:hypothetical protein sS8_2498 [Methylocaldum marinum]|uniref:Uncharacterized protein n=2 Tax=Methylocaldum marinum TaxID=1432792 RepID=A0A250KS08_9GAMM|nr:hypothetical protein sS8_2498 [Methylocaldum marinum]